MNWENSRLAEDNWQVACGKIILFGEHAVVYGARAIAAAIPNAVRARAFHADSTQIVIPRWQVSRSLDEERDDDLMCRTIALISRSMAKEGAHFRLEIDPLIPPASGLGASAALAVASIRALAQLFDVELSLQELNAMAYECEKLAHGTPSGLDNTLATYGGLVQFCRQQDGSVDVQRLACAVSLPLLVMLSGQPGYTAATVAKVRRAREKHTAYYDAIFAEIDAISGSAVGALKQGDFVTIASLMDRNHRLLREIGVSCEALETLISLAKSAGADGAKLTGSGEGGAAIAYCGNKRSQVKKALQDRQWQTMDIEVLNAD